MKVNLANFPELGNLHLRRGLSIAGVDTSRVTNGATNTAKSTAQITANEIAQAANAARTKADQISDRLQTLSEDIKLHLPAYYAVGLWGYCQGDHSTGPFSNCSEPSTSFSFDLLEIFGSASEEINEILPEDDNKVLAGYRKVSRWTISAYVSGFTFTLVAIIMQILLMVFSKGRIFLIASSILASVFITGASVSATVIYGLITGSIQSVLQPLGAHASLGAQTITATWLAAVFSIISSLMWLIEMCCCCF
ncbi:Actin cortical patch SUR7/pH-response regulator PalI [Penicillium camemberti]|uniref:Actin cortical patch SUR7/pH-response regulator PalI n=1 Tax=Penicillium camemberti (strain FM 013) TaxID=1429867 RepID=A0A0G4PXK7_PENC3|nr:Actin cortical patch SUR7/pH-response regulator PalI [Penicillium camemberti]